MKIINILDNGTKINFGVWISAISTAKDLKKSFDIDSEIWFPEAENVLLDDSVTTVQLPSTSIPYLHQLIQERGLDPKEVIVQTHGSWRFSTKWGYEMKKMGFRWIYTPHGMLNTHGFETKKYKKIAYWNLMEKWLVKKADFVRVVSAQEGKEMQKLTGTNTKIRQISNGIPTHQADLSKKDKGVKTFLFMSRLFYGKGILPLVKAWVSSSLNNNPEYRLVIAGPDQGELEKVNAVLAQFPSNNVSYVGPIYGEEKEAWLDRSTYFVLPSFSEAFSTSILEAMSHGCIPLITPNCNFPEVFEKGLGIEITTEENGIKNGLETTLEFAATKIEKMQSAAARFVNTYYSLGHIAKTQAHYFFNIEKPLFKLEEKNLEKCA